MAVLFFNHGFSSIADAIEMIREARGTHPITIVASHRDPDGPALHFADIAILEPRDLDDPAYLDWCLAQCRQHRVTHFIAQKRRSMLIDHAEQFAAIGTRVFAPADGDTLRLIEDKARFYDAALAAGLPMAWTREIQGVAEFDAALTQVRALGHAPCIKPPEGVFGHGFWLLRDDQPLFSTLMNPDSHRIAPSIIRGALTEAAAKGQPSRLLVMQHLAGLEWSVDCVCRNGALIAGVSRCKAGRAQILGTDGPEFDIARKAIAAFGLSGLINVQCKATDISNSELCLLEINTRMSGGCAWTRHAGINLPWIMVANLLGLPDGDAPPVPQSGALVATRTISYVARRRQDISCEGENAA